MSYTFLYEQKVYQLLALWKWFVNIYVDSQAANFIRTVLMLTNGIQYVNDQYWKITGIHLTFVYLVNLRSNSSTTLGFENLENTNNSEDWALTLVVYKKVYPYIYEQQQKWSMLEIMNTVTIQQPRLALVVVNFKSPA